jgi:hypothetical protein
MRMRACVLAVVVVVGACDEEGAEEITTRTSALTAEAASTDDAPLIEVASAGSEVLAFSPPLDAQISAMVASVSGSRIKTDLTKLAGMTTRNSCSTTSSSTNGIGAARTYVRDRFRAVGLSAEFDAFSATFCGFTRTHRNVYAWIPGTDPSRIVVVGGHMDSRSTNSTSQTQAAPGANDSGSQTSVVLEAARAMAGQTFQATVVFATFTGEEQGLNGSKNLSGKLATLFPGATVEAALISDIVGGDVSANDATTLHQFRLFAPGTPRERSSGAPTGTPDDTSPARGLLRAIALYASAYVPDMTLLPNLREDRPGRGSDHISFNDRGVPGVRFIEARENTAHQHNSTDTIANMTRAYPPRIARVMVAAAASLARAPSAPKSLTVSGSAGGVVNLSWSVPASAVDHYVVAARPVTANFYGSRVSVSGTSAGVTAAALGVPAGSPFFVSVAAVDAAGHESLFAYPEFRCDASCAIQPGSLDITTKI